MIYDSLDVNIPNAYKDAEGSDNFWQSLKDHKSEHGQSFMRVITLAGPTGTGKTHDACAWLHAARWQRKTLGYIRATDIWQVDHKDLYVFTAVKCLVIDDYGKRQTEGALQRVSDIVDDRMNRGDKYTMLTTNVLTEIRDLDPRLASRINQGCVIDYTGLPDLRESQK